MGRILPSRQQAQARLCSTALTQVHSSRDHVEIPTTVHDNSYSHQTMVGVSRQLGTEWAVEVSYQHGSASGRSDQQPEPDLRPNTGDNIPFSIIASRVYPEWGYIAASMRGWSGGTPS